MKRDIIHANLKFILSAAAAVGFVAFTDTAFARGSNHPANQVIVTDDAEPAAPKALSPKSVEKASKFVCGHARYVDTFRHTEAVDVTVDKDTLPNKLAHIINFVPFIHLPIEKDRQLEPFNLYAKICEIPKVGIAVIPNQPVADDKWNSLIVPAIQERIAKGALTSDQVASVDPSDVLAAHNVQVRYFKDPLAAQTPPPAAITPVVAVATASAPVVAAAPKSTPVVAAKTAAPVVIASIASEPLSLHADAEAKSARLKINYHHINHGEIKITAHLGAERFVVDEKFDSTLGKFTVAKAPHVPQRLLNQMTASIAGIVAKDTAALLATEAKVKVGVRQINKRTVETPAPASDTYAPALVSQLDLLPPAEQTYLIGPVAFDALDQMALTGDTSSALKVANTPIVPQDAQTQIRGTAVAFGTVAPPSQNLEGTAAQEKVTPADLAAAAATTDLAFDKVAALLDDLKKAAQTVIPNVEESLATLNGRLDIIPSKVVDANGTGPAVSMDDEKTLTPQEKEKFVAELGKFAPLATDRMYRAAVQVSYVDNVIKKVGADASLKFASVAAAADQTVRLAGSQCASLYANCAAAQNQAFDAISAAFAKGNAATVAMAKDTQCNVAAGFNKLAEACQSHLTTAYAATSDWTAQLTQVTAEMARDLGHAGIRNSRALALSGGEAFIKLSDNAQSELIRTFALANNFADKSFSVVQAKYQAALPIVILAAAAVFQPAHVAAHTNDNVAVTTASSFKSWEAYAVAGVARVESALVTPEGAVGAGVVVGGTAALLRKAFKRLGSALLAYSAAAVGKQWKKMQAKCNAFALSAIDKMNAWSEKLEVSKVELNSGAATIKPVVVANDAPSSFVKEPASTQPMAREKIGASALQKEIDTATANRILYDGKFGQGIRRARRARGKERAAQILNHRGVTLG